MVSGPYRQSLDRFQDLVTTEVIRMAQLYRYQEPTGTSMVTAHAMAGVTTFPCAFLTILPVTLGNQPVVLVRIHCVRQYIHPATDGVAATNDLLNNRTFLFMGDCFLPQLPTILEMEPIDDGGPVLVHGRPNDYRHQRGRVHGSLLHDIIRRRVQNGKGKKNTTRQLESTTI
jgi:hypothetical protein